MLPYNYSSFKNYIYEMLKIIMKGRSVCINIAPSAS